MTSTDTGKDGHNLYVLQNNPAIIEMLRRRGATEARCVLPTLEKLNGESTIVDLGCGIGTITTFIARSAKELCRGNVQIIGIDRDENSLSQAQKLCEQMSLTNVHFMKGDIHDLSQEIQTDSVDLVYMNAVLMYSPDPSQVLRETMRSLKPGGTTIVRDLDPGCGVWYPKNLLRSKWVELFDRSISYMGGTLGISLQLPKLAAETGFSNIEPFGENIRLKGSELQVFSEQMAGLVHGGLGKQWIAMEWCSEDEAKAIADAWASLPNEDGAIVGNLWGGVIATKPVKKPANR